MRNLSKMITHRERESHAVEATLAIHAELGGDRSAAFFADVLEDGETLPDFDFVFELLRRKIVRSREQMLEAERLHRDEITNDRIPRARRDELVRELRREIIDWRQVFHALVGKDKAIEIGFVTPLPRDARVLVRTANVIVGNLERSMKGELELVKPGVRVDLSVILEKLCALGDELAAVITDIDLARRELERAVIHKQQALAAFDELFPRSSRVIEALFTLCGEGEVAKRVRPSVRKMVRPEAEPLPPRLFEEAGESRNPAVARRSTETYRSPMFDGRAATAPGSSPQGELRSPPGRHQIASGVSPWHGREPVARARARSGAR